MKASTKHSCNNNLDFAYKYSLVWLFTICNHGKSAMSNSSPLGGALFA